MDLGGASDDEVVTRYVEQGRRERDEPGEQ